jgi:hypothetical protein
MFRHRFDRLRGVCGKSHDRTGRHVLGMWRRHLPRMLVDRFLPLAGAASSHAVLLQLSGHAQCRPRREGNRRVRSRQSALHELLEWRACYGSKFPRALSKRAPWLVQRLSVEESPDRITPARLATAMRMYRKLRSDERLRLCQKFFAERAARLATFTVLYRHGGRLVALRQEAPTAEDAAYAVSAAVGHKCAIVAVMDARVEFFTDGDVPQVFRFWDNPNLIIEIGVWRDLKRTRKIKTLT